MAAAGWLGMATAGSTGMAAAGWLGMAVAALLGLSPASFAGEYAVEVERIGALTGPRAPGEMKSADICGTDLGTMAEIGGTIVMAFGDTFGWQGEHCTRFGPNWRSNVVGFTTDGNPSDGVVIENWLRGADGKAVAAREGAHSDAFKGEQSRIPTAMVAVGDRLYLHTMSVHGFASMGGVWLCNSSGFGYSDDAGKTWHKAEAEFGDFKSAFNMLALSADGGGGNENGEYVYALGTACGRFSGARAARVKAGEVLDVPAWEYFDGEGWSPDPAQAVEIIRPGVGEGSLVWNEGLNQWMYTTLNELSEAIELRFAPRPEGPWSAPLALATMADYPQGYGAFMTPAWISKNGLIFYFVMSQFGPYNTYVMKARLTPIR